MTSKQSTEVTTVYETDYVALQSRGGWYYVERKGVTGIVAVVPVTEDDRLILIEQYRPAVDRMVIELPAGLAGDVPGEEDEVLESAAQRELLEETGYRAGRLRRLFSGPPSPGITNEILTFFLATDLQRVHAGGGDASEEIRVHTPLIKKIPAWLDAQVQAGKLIDVKVYAGLYAISASA